MPAAPERDVYTVTRLNREVRMLLDSGLPALWLEGELSNFAAPASGHWYFSLKDRDAQIRCAMFRARNLGTGFRPKDGQHLMVRGRVSLYEPRGDYQMIVEAMELAGEGELRRQFERLKAKLAAEGLFDAALKRPLPAIAWRIAVVTSPTGAAIRDILHILARRFPAATIRVHPAPVQGAAAAEAIVEAINEVQRIGEADVLILARGGGSIEDLWSFNDERVARAIRRGDIPVITGIGHEIDFTIADFAADVRAPTPSGAAEIAVPDQRELLGQLESLSRRLAYAMERALVRGLDRHQQLVKRLSRAHPGTRLRQQVQRLDELDLRLRAAWENHLARLAHRLQLAQRGLDAISPLATLGRGYAIITGPNGVALQDAAQVSPGDEIHARLARGRLTAQVIARRDE
ncbi:MAG: exodeoxyribonuclease VII large subunit [Nevskiaceae bacterium]|jgi:exodeoxyribonuclease VII large subunit|nr:exodeoxyribonuclease VII large subunit [Nevskiaceae bacterium]